jgi:peptidylprolyl isomerase
VILPLAKSKVSGNLIFMKKHLLFTLFASFALMGANTPPKAPSEIIAQAPVSAWQEIDADDIIIFTLKDNSQFIMQIADDIAPVHGANVKKLVRANWFEKTSVVRVQDNYVVQWGAPENTPLPDNIITKPPAEYEFSKPKNFKQINYRDAYAMQIGYVNSWPVASNGKQAWLTHCYGMVGVGRDLAPDTGTGQELYTNIGHSPRHLDRNITSIGRIILGMENLTARKRGTGQMGFYEKDDEKTPIISAKIASDLPKDQRPNFESLKTNTKVFDNWLYAKANRGGPFFIKPAGAIDICNAQVPIRKK